MAQPMNQPRDQTPNTTALQAAVPNPIAQIHGKMANHSTVFVVRRSNFRITAGRAGRGGWRWT